jgi:hypothetical protein
MILEHWGATPSEVARSMTGDDICPSARLIATRAITLDAPPSDVFPWLRQMGFGRGGWYSYDFVDNLGRRSARSINPKWQTLSNGDKVPGGPASFTAMVVDSPRALVLALGDGSTRARKVVFTLAYELHDHSRGTRLVSRVRARIDVPAGHIIERLFLGPGDGIMLRRQLLNLAQRIK